MSGSVYSKDPQVSDESIALFTCGRCADHVYDVCIVIILDKPRGSLPAARFR